ncbi:MAG: arabinofuranosyltransferase [Bradymonadia bacterium]
MTWNAGERVQSYTHPLWMMLLTLGHWISGEAYFTALTVSFACLAGLLIGMGRGWRDSPAVLIAAFTCLLASKSFVDYSTSGLENPLTHLILLGFFVTAHRRPDRFGLLCLLAAMGMVNRLDTALLYAPTLLWVFIAQVREQGVLRAIGWGMLGFAPLVGWEIFSIVYYGLPIPNTALAKLNVGLPKADLIEQGLTYYQSSFARDYVTLGVIGAGLLMLFALRVRLAAALGASAYLLYIVWIGGDFMSGRFFSAPLVVVVIACAQAARARSIRPPLPVGLAVAVFMLGLIPAQSPIRSGADYGSDKKLRDDWRGKGGGVADERAVYFRQAGLLNAFESDAPWPVHNWANQGREKRAAHAEEGIEFELIARRPVGYYGYFAGPTVHIVDPLALTDPLLARLPTDPFIRWRIGHFTRRLPAGYTHSLRTGENKIRDKDLRLLWDDLVLAIHAPLLAEGRWAAIWRLNTGHHAPHVAAYMARYSKAHRRRAARKSAQKRRARERKQKARKQARKQARKEARRQK